MNKLSGLSAIAMATVTAGAAAAQEALEVIGKPTAGALGFQPAATDIAEHTHRFDTFLLWIISVISIFVLILMLIVVFRYNKRMNPTPKSFTHNTGIEVAWTVIPILILVAIGTQSVPLLFKQQKIPEGDVVIRVTGYQWYWGYEYSEHEFAFDSFLLARDELAEHGYSDDLYLLATDTAVVIPTGKKIVMNVTGADVIHSWTIPAFGVKQDAVPGRTAQLWFEVDPGKEGIYFGQCSELCGKDHAYMPITVKAVTQAEYEKWLDGAIEEYAGKPRSVDVASAD